LAFAENVSLALTDAKTVSDMNEAFHDSLTGLASRALFLERLTDALAAGAAAGAGNGSANGSGGGSGGGREPAEPRLALLFIDLDRFKQVNDTLGHADAAMYQAKRNGRGRQEMFLPGMAHGPAQRPVNADLRRAIDEFVQRVASDR